MANARRNRKTRRRMRASLKHGSGASPTHKGRSGRTGRMHTKKLQSRRGVEP